MKPAKHGRDHGPRGEDPIPLGGGNFEIKVFADTQVTVAGDGKFIFAIPADLDGTSLTVAEGYLTTVASSVTNVQIRNVTQAVDMLSAKIRVDTGEFTSYTSSVPTVIVPGQPVATGERIAVDVDSAGTGGKGLGVILTFA